MHYRSNLDRSVNKLLGGKPPFKDPPTQKDIKRMENEIEHAEQFGILEPPEFKESECSTLR